MLFFHDLKKREQKTTNILNIIFGFEIYDRATFPLFTKLSSIYWIEWNYLFYGLKYMSKWLAVICYYSMCLVLWEKRQILAHLDWEFVDEIELV